MSFGSMSFDPLVVWSYGIWPSVVWPYVCEPIFVREPDQSDRAEDILETDKVRKPSNADNMM